MKKNSRLKFMLYITFLSLENFQCMEGKKISDTCFVFDTLSNNRFLCSGILINKKKYGIWNDYYENGQLQYVQTFVDDKLNGPWISYRDNGNIFTIGQYENNLKKGEWLYYDGYPDHIAMKEYYSNDKKVGTWEYYDDYGRLELKVKYGENEKEEILIDNRLPVPGNPNK